MTKSTITLNASKRIAKAPLSDLRKKGFIPAVYYGAKQESTPISVKEIDFLKALKEAGESTVVVVKDESGEHECLIHDIARDAVSEKVIHTDFYVLEKGKAVKVKVPLEFVGVSEAVKSGANLVKVMHEVEIEAQPQNLPHSIEVDISKIVTLEDQIHAKDLKMPNGVTLFENPEEVIALAQAQKEESEEAPATIDLESIEVEKKGKKEEDAAEPAKE